MAENKNKSNIHFTDRKIVRYGTVKESDLPIHPLQKPIKTKEERQSDIIQSHRYTLGNKTAKFSFKALHDRSETPNNKGRKFYNTKNCRNSFDTFNPFENETEAVQGKLAESVRDVKDDSNYKELFELLQKDYHIVLEENKNLKQRLETGLQGIYRRFEETQLDRGCLGESEPKYTNNPMNEPKDPANDAGIERQFSEGKISNSTRSSELDYIAKLKKKDEEISLLKQLLNL